MNISSTFPYVRDIILPTGEFCCVDINRHAVPVTRDITVPETFSSTVVSLTRPDPSQPPCILYTRTGTLVSPVLNTL